MDSFMASFSRHLFVSIYQTEQSIVTLTCTTAVLGEQISLYEKLHLSPNQFFFYSNKTWCFLSMSFDPPLQPNTTLCDCLNLLLVVTESNPALTVDYISIDVLSKIRLGNINKTKTKDFY